MNLDKPLGHSDNEGLLFTLAVIGMLVVALLWMGVCYLVLRQWLSILAAGGISAASFPLALRLAARLNTGHW